MKAVIQLMFRLTFGILAVGFGLAIICWICYNQFVERLPQSHSSHWWEPVGIGPVLIATSKNTGVDTERSEP